MYNKQKAAELVAESQLFQNSIIDFVLSKKLKNKTKYIIGITDNHNQEQCFLFKPDTKEKVINSCSLHYKNKIERELFDECIEGYLLFCLDSGYQLSYMNLQSHICVWDFLETYLFELNYMIKGVKNYLQFCKETGITLLLINSYTNSFYPDFFSFFMNEQFNLQLIVQQSVGKIDVLLGYQSDLFNSVVYEVIVTNHVSHEVLYRHTFSQFNYAVNDYKKQYYELCINHYKSEEEYMKKILDEFHNHLEIINY